MQSKLWENDEMTEEEAEEVMKKAELLKIKMVRASERMKQWGMETGLNRFAKRHARTHARTHANLEDEEGEAARTHSRSHRCAPRCGTAFL